MKSLLAGNWIYCLLFCSLVGSGLTSCGQTVVEGVTLGPYEYETKPDDPAFAIFNLRKAPQPGDLLIRPGDRLAICGDSITEQKMYSRIIETYLTACVPQYEVTVRQYGWSGEKTDGFLRRMDQDCLRFDPTLATLCYGMNDARYRPYDATNGRWYEDHYRAIVRKFKQADVRVVVGSPGCMGKVASWVSSGSGTLDQQNINLCALRDIAMGVAEDEGVAFADVFWPMLQAQVFAPGQHQATKEQPYNVAGRDGVHPDWAGHVVMAYAFLRSLGLDGSIAEINIDLGTNTATVSDGHTLQSYGNGTLRLVSDRYPFCADGPIDRDNSIRSGMTLVPFYEELNRFQLTATGGDSDRYKVTWGEHSREYSADELAAGINLAKEFPQNPFSKAFQEVDSAVKAKQDFETHQIKQVFHGERGRDNLQQAVAETEAKRQPLADSIARAHVPVEHTITIAAVEQ
ncbi:SGNH/GDSL hydrolase family protein [Aeoliella sp. ICT_H6.2]|uniref:SGNH/GDSL hydrolase family protein n=1 Tax=Aeoliella straminimaris TaxID=2954799 RepID=A0A9X2FHS8_9BACT|nr:SGNH/GDSL hydrolase family protein [Aeoliella straminimaris]MCO6047164.1 SGNH/GDSL hydrolase family protein [Aeoliella straminimaris]